MSAMVHAEPMVSKPGMTDAGNKPATERPWWKHGMVWLVIGGPAVVVVAGLVTAVIAIRGADTIVVDPPTRSTPMSSGQAPAIQARNHAATPKP
jgi:hypothetical protein